MKRAIVLVMDSFGIGGAEDAEQFGDAGSDTLGHIAAECAAGRADKEGLRAGGLTIPNLTRLGLARAAQASTGTVPDGLDGAVEPESAWGLAAERSLGKDTPSGHWEMAGVPIKLSRTPGALGGPAPALGQHTEEVLTELLGLSSDEVAELKAEGVI